MRRETRSTSSDAAVMIPRPPSWISPRMTASPKPDQYVGVSTTTRPVTHTALVAVNRATMKGALSPPAREIGRRSRSVPRAIAAANPTTTALEGCRKVGRAARVGRTRVVVTRCSGGARAWPRPDDCVSLHDHSIVGVLDPARKELDRQGGVKTVSAGSQWVHDRGRTCGAAAALSRCRPRGGEDLRDAQRGAPACRARDRRGRCGRGHARQGARGGAPRGPRAGPLI